MSSPPNICSRSTRTRCVKPGSPLERISLELSRHCNLQCRYCYTQASQRDRGGLSDLELRRIISEAVELGASLVSIVAGGEPLLRPSITAEGESIIDHANGVGCYCYLYTNCTLINRHSAQFLWSRDVSVVGKLNSLDERVQDDLVGVRGSARLIRRGIDTLLEAGFASTNPSRLALETIICPRNYEEIPILWHWMRSRNIVPEIEIPTLHGRALDHMNDIAFDAAEAPQKYEALFRELARIDRETYGFEWEPHPPFPGASCRLFENNCYINAQGGVQPCAGVDCALGWLRVADHAADGQPLSEIVKTPAFLALREVRSRVLSPCRDCDLLAECYGCRGAAFHATGNMFAADPVCWRAPKVAKPALGTASTPFPRACRKAE